MGLYKAMPTQVNIFIVRQKLSLPQIFLQHFPFFLFINIYLCCVICIRDQHMRDQSITSILQFCCEANPCYVVKTHCQRIISVGYAKNICVFCCATSTSTGIQIFYRTNKFPPNTMHNVNVYRCGYDLYV